MQRNFDLLVNAKCVLCKGNLTYKLCIEFQFQFTENTARFLYRDQPVNPLNAELNPICHLLALLGAHHILHISRIRVNAV